MPRWQRRERISILITANSRDGRANQNMKHSLALLILLTVVDSAHCQTPRVFSDAGNIFVERSSGTTKLTGSEMDVDPVLSPNGTFVVYTRQGRSRGPPAYEPDQFCTTQPRPDELRRINVEGIGDQLLLKGRPRAPERQLCDFKSKQFSSDGRRLYFLTPGWATSDALHVYDMRAGEEHFLLPANDALVLNFCRSKYKDHLVVLSHRYFFFGGSYDWYWLYDSAGKNELGPLGEFASREDLVRAAHSEWCENKP
jgi:hypothetical protein